MVGSRGLRVFIHSIPLCAYKETLLDRFTGEEALRRDTDRQALAVRNYMIELYQNLDFFDTMLRKFEWTGDR